MRRSVLIVDDNPVNLKLAAVILSPYYQLSITDNGATAIKIAEFKRPDLILLDIMMPDISGFDLCVRFKKNERTKNIPIIFLTAKNEASDIMKAFEIGGVDYILKPFNASDILFRVKAQIDLKDNQEKF
ncbi:MAG: response regulator [Ignavibacteria bacterium]